MELKSLELSKTEAFPLSSILSKHMARIFMARFGPGITMVNKKTLGENAENYSRKIRNSASTNDFSSSFHKISIIGCKMIILRSVETHLVGKIGLIVSESHGSVKLQVGSRCINLCRKGLYGKLFFSGKCFIVNFELFGPHRKRLGGLVKSQLHFVGV